MQKRTFKIYRYDPEKDEKPYMQTIDIELEGNERMLLDALIKLKAIDPSISYRRSCRAPCQTQSCWLRAASRTSPGSGPDLR